jgi:4-hydroxy-3-methylbut-2-en-1-yl diphosphate reductase
MIRGVNASNKDSKQDVIIDTRSGFCFGVINAIHIAENYLAKHGKLYCLGDIVHNEAEIKRLENLGLIIIDFHKFRTLKNETVLLRAHGEPPETYRIAYENNIKLVDASCPVVLKLQNKVKILSDTSKRPVYIFGKKGHAEIIGLLGQVPDKEIHVFQNYQELENRELPDKLVLISQTTQDADELRTIKENLKQRGIDLHFYNSICGQVSNRKKEISSFVKKVDTVIFVSGSKSSNGKVLFEVCKKSNPDTHFISDIQELKQEWFTGKSKIGICGATSTPRWLMEQVKKAIENC